tara:strand:+ start:244 stop:645 length:402 start_codon:yes stop_codon:yes gene_type:complete
MKRHLIILYSVISTALIIPQMTFGQIAESNLTEQEAHLLDSLLQNKKSDFSFVNKKVAFISGHSATNIQNKYDFFKIHINSYLDKGLNPIIKYRILDKNEKSQSGGFDVIVMQIPKILTKKQHQINIHNLKKK